MVDYHVLSLPSLDANNLASAKAVDHGVALSAEQVPWASKQLWAPDAAYNAKTNKYHLFFPTELSDELTKGSH